MSVVQFHFSLRQTATPRHTQHMATNFYCPWDRCNKLHLRLPTPAALQSMTVPKSLKGSRFACRMPSMKLSSYSCQGMNVLFFFMADYVLWFQQLSAWAVAVEGAKLAQLSGKCAAAVFNIAPEIPLAGISAQNHTVVSSLLPPIRLK